MMFIGLVISLIVYYMILYISCGLSHFLKCKKQDIVARSSIKVEYHVMTPTTFKIVWLRWLLSYMDAPLFESTPMYYVTPRFPNVKIS
jgi:hypothetical protein